MNTEELREIFAQEFWKDRFSHLSDEEEERGIEAMLGFLKRVYENEKRIRVSKEHVIYRIPDLVYYRMKRLIEFPFLKKLIDFCTEYNCEMEIIPTEFFDDPIQINFIINRNTARDIVERLGVED